MAKLLYFITCYILLHIVENSISLRNRAVHFAKVVDVTNDGTVYNAETIFGVSIDDCIDACTATKECVYINYHMTWKACYLIGHLGTSEPNIESKSGYIFGNKLEWDLQGYEQCSECEDRGVCSAAHGGQRCRDSGCGPPPIFAGTTVNGNMYAIGHKILYDCVYGYVPADDPVSTCLENGTWSVPQLYCVCPPDWFVIQDSCYMVTGPTNITDAKDFCSSHNAHVVTLETIEENNSLKIKLSELQDDAVGYLTAYMDRAIEGTWVAMGSTALLEIDDWALGEPNLGERANCMAFSKEDQYQWIDTNCNKDGQKSICEKPFSYTDNL